MIKIGINIFYAFIILFLASSGIWWEVYKYNDCINVGHSKLYCIFNIGGK